MLKQMLPVLSEGALPMTPSGFRVQEALRFGVPGLLNPKPSTLYPKL